MKTLMLSGRKILASVICTAGLALFPIQTASAQEQNLDSLLNEVRAFTQEDRQEDRARLNSFTQDKAEQQKLLNQARNRLKQSEDEQNRLKSLFDTQEDQLAELETLLKQRTGQLGEVFGVVKEQSAELKELLNQSLVNAQFPGRQDTLAFASDKAIPGMDKLETLWFQLQHEMTHSGKIARFDTQVAGIDGQFSSQNVLRIGGFNAVNSDGQYLQWNPVQQQLSVLAGQPKLQNQSDARAFYTGQGDHVLTDISNGQLLALIGQKPTLEDQIHKGGYVGYIILALGVLGLLTATIRLLALSITRLKIRKQLKNPEPQANNPLGRILLACQGRYSLEQLNNRLDEALLKELPYLESGQSILKLLAAAAPLLGLLGTVTGMIGTFQSITLFGTSDPKLMAGGISQALITTVFGLIVAIPMLFCHGMLSSQSRSLLMILQEKSLAQLNMISGSDSTSGQSHQNQQSRKSLEQNTQKQGEGAGEAVV
ncbi:MotA/TolQ/ExbB proton channel family protein [Oceanospirillum sediminis]|uniref:MotA/TolQ/ExbB proton channel family protein n=1 Tax=Oceanospirillum sediminis TaxID=2760088 RepID=A0A839IN52_9GAMM|nr:MotA/TolQ/ExbB proton channel family protein [Oceanospirillum sediminis]MBB1485942.1 MotA/TolQ/ExbB proton channel family protein [Oceanospirillum sediminis]